MQTVNETPKHIEDFHKLCRIVAEEFRVEPQDVVERRTGGMYKTPRHVVAAVYSNWGTLRETAELLNMNNHQSVAYSRRRVQDLMNTGRYKAQLKRILDRVEKELPLMLP